MFELLTNKGEVIDACVKSDYVERDGQWVHEQVWIDAHTQEPIPPEGILAWRDPYTCEDARQAIEAYFRNPGSIVTRDYLGNAKARHIYMGEDGKQVACPDCLAYYERLRTR